MSNASFLTVDDRELSLRDCMRYLQSSGKLQEFLGGILRQHVLEEATATRDDLEIPEGVVEQAIIDFRLQQKLTDAPAFQEWLKKNGSDYSTFHKQILGNFRIEKLKMVVSEERLQEYFIERKLFLDRVILSRIIVDSQDLAEELKTQIQEGSATYEELARQYSITDDKMVNGMMGPVSRGTLPDSIRAQIDSAQPGALLGPLELEGKWGLFRVDEFLEASMDDAQLQQSLRNELFEKWISEKIQKMEVKLQIND
jgi:parvulin-like peptidyl-prolyl isomerase